MKTILTMVCVTVLAVVIGFESSSLKLFGRENDPLLIATIVMSWLLFAGAFLLLRRVPARHATAVVVAGSLLVGGAALLGPPNTSTDSARYAWDGIVAGAGISPYEHVPAADSLEELRPDWLFPPPTMDAEGKPHCIANRIMRTRTIPGDEVLCTAINRPHVPTIYPPAAELYFAGVRFLVPVTAEYWPFQLGGLLISLSITAMLLRALRRRGADPRWAALWAWCPIVASEAVTNSHVDVLGVALALAASLLAVSGRRIWAGVALGAAIATKLIPVIVAPPLLKKRPFTLIGVSVATFAVLYVPYIIQSGFGVLGYLPGYLSEEGYDNGSRFALLSLVVPGSSAALVAAALVAVVAGLCWWRADPASPWLAQLVLVGLTLVILSPAYPWYALLMIPFIVLSGRWEWFAVPLAITVRMLIPGATTSRIGLAAALVIVVAGWLWRRRRHAEGERSDALRGVTA